MVNQSLFGSSQRVSLAHWVALLAFFLLLPVFSAAQDNSLISGTVTDKSGAAVVGAQVVVASTGGNLTRTTQTNADGVFVASALPSGAFDVLITAKGFQKFEAKGVILAIAQKARVDVVLTVGTVTEEIVVTGENVAQVDTQSSDIGTTITGKQINQLELNGRNFSQLINLSPGVVNQTGQDEGTVGVTGSIAYSVNGGRTEYNNWQIDGGDNMDNGSNGTLNVYPNLEAIAEFKVLTSNYGAQYGKNGSGTVEVETKSGTSQFHGSAFEYFRNEALNANSWANNGTGVPRQPYRKNDYGYTIGGPVYIPHFYNTDKKKTFFFWSQEWRKELVPGSSYLQNVPSAAERGGNFNDACPTYTGATFDVLTYPGCPYQPGSLGAITSNYATPFTNNTLPNAGAFSSTANALLSFIPASNYTNGGLPAYTANPSFHTNWREELIRVDHNLTENERLTFRYIHDTWSTVNQGPLWGGTTSFNEVNTDFVGPGTSFVARLTSNISPKLLSEFVASYTADHIFLTNANDVGLPAGGIDLLPLFPSAFNAAGKVPAFSVGPTTDGVLYGSGGFGVDTGYFPWKNANPTYTYREIMTAIVGNHSLFFGGYVAFAQKNEQASNGDIQGNLSFSTTNPNTSGNPFADLLLGQIGGYSQVNASPYFYNRYKIFEPFFQDDWRITKKFTLNLGLRWSFFGRYQEKDFQEYNFSPAKYAPLSGPALYDYTDPNAQLLLPTTNPLNGFEQCGAITPSSPQVSTAITGCMKNKYVNPGPRFGFAYDPFGDGKWAIRGGYGIFFEHMNGNEGNSESLEGNPSPFVANGGVSTISGYPNVGLGAQGAPSPFSAISIPGRAEWPYMQQWNLGVQHELPAHMVASVAYVGSKGTHLTRQYDLNQLQPLPASQNPFLASGAPITPADCSGFAPGTPFVNQGLPTSAVLANGTTITGQAVQNLFVACGNPAAAYYRPYQGFGDLTALENTANSSYNSLQAVLRRSYGDLTFNLGYTWSHSIDTASDRYDPGFYDPTNLRLSRASSNFDVRQAMALSYVYAIPLFRHSSGLIHAMLGGWQWSGITIAQTGVPFSAVDGTQYGDNAGVAANVGIAAFPDVVGNPNSVPAAIQSQFQATGLFGKLLYNTTAFQTPVGLTYGDATRNMLRMPGRLNFDMGLFKTFQFKERYAFEFRWETFNTFNHTQLDSFSGTNPGGSGGAGGTIGMPNTPSTCSTTSSSGQTISDPTCGGFLVLNGAHNSRIMQFGLRFQF